MKHTASFGLLVCVTVTVLLFGTLSAAAGDPRPHKPHKAAPQAPIPTRDAVSGALSAPEATWSYDDIPTRPVTIDRQTACGGREIERTFTVSESFTVYDVRVGFNAVHAYRGDIRLSLRSPADTLVEIISPSVYNSWANYDLMLSDATANPIDDLSDDATASPYYDRLARPSNPFGAFIGQGSAGVWTLIICDDAPDADDGAYNRSQLVLESPPEGPALRAGKTADKHVVAQGAVITYDITIRNLGLAAADSTTLNDPIPAGTSYVNGSLSTTGTPPASYDGSAITWTGTIGSWQSTTVTYQVQVTSAPAMIDNSATVSHASLPSPLVAAVSSQSFAEQDYLYTNEADYPIPDDECATPVTAPILVSDSFTIAGVRVGVNLEHAYRGDVRVSLQSPAGPQVVIMSPDPSDWNRNFDVLADGASTHPLNDNSDDDIGIPFYERQIAPANPLSVFNGQDAAGTWTLTVCDTSQVDKGALKQWSLFFDSATPPCDAPAAITDLGIAKSSATQVLLSWSAVDGAGSYHLWRGLTPYFTPGADCAAATNCAVISTGTSDTQIALGNVAENNAWLVQPVASCGTVQPTPSNRVAEFEFTLTPGAS